ncbi:MAG TPA: ATP synthase F0 subunit C [Bryobacteraceae bacterium]|nr:ATP synthase F0 subunit C [Bryobacteraceae bacterium]
MIKKLAFLATAMMLASLPIFAQTPGSSAAPADGHSWMGPFAAIGMAIASGLCALGQGKAVAGAAEGMARNPGATASIRFALIFGLVLIESLALYTLTIIFVFK